MRLVVTIWDILVIFFVGLCVILFIGNYIYTTIKYVISEIKTKHRSKHKDNIRDINKY